MTSKFDIALIHRYFVVFFALVLFSCNPSQNRDATPRLTQSNVDLGRTLNQASKTKAKTRVLRHIPLINGTNAYYEKAQKFRESILSAADFDELLAQSEGRRFILVESINVSWGSYDAAFLFERSPGDIVAYSGGHCSESATVQRSIAVDVFEGNLTLLRDDNEHCTEEYGGAYSASDVTAFRLVWSEGGNEREYWVLGGFLLFPRHETMLSEDCLKFLEHLSVVHRSCKNCVKPK